MTTFLQIIVSIFLHPVAVLLAWINIVTRTDLSTTAKILWALVCLIWGLGPIIYILVGDGKLW